MKIYACVTPIARRICPRILIPILGSAISLISFDVKAAPVVLLPQDLVAVQGWPSLQPGRTCSSLQKNLQSLVGKETSMWSVSVLDPRGHLIANINAGIPLIPASSQKLISTAFALDKLGPDFKLRTQLVRRSDGVLEMSGEGDPDLGIPEIQRFAMVALAQGGSSLLGNAEPLQLIIREEPRHHWWPNGWNANDRLYAYGAPITRLAVTSNALNVAVTKPVSRLERLFKSEIVRKGGNALVKIVNHDQIIGNPNQTLLLHQESSAPMHALLSLANAESHNFTSEVLLRHAAKHWDVKLASYKAIHWMQRQNLPIKGLRISDGSGLSRLNRVSSLTLAMLLMRMRHHPLAPYYQSSMAIAGQRGTLRKYFKGTSLEGRFWGKTGTLRGVRSISGVLETSDGPRFISAIANGASNPTRTIGMLLKEVERFSPCSSTFSTLKPLFDHG